MGKLFAGLDVSQDKTSICVVDQAGRNVFETEVASNASSIALALKPFRRVISKVGHETGTFAPWLHKELLRHRFPVVCLDARKTRAAMAPQRNKTDRNDARDMAIMLSRGFEGAAHVKSNEAHQIRLLLTCRSAVIRRTGDLKRVLRTTLKTFGASLSKSDGKLVVNFPARRRDVFVSDVCRTMIECHDALLQYARLLDAQARKLARSDCVCRRLMTAPGVGPITALTFRAAVDDAKRFSGSRLVGAYFGLTPRRIQSGRKDFAGHISHFGDTTVRTALYEAAAVLLTNCKRMTPLRAWGLRLKAKKGFKLACTACARKLAVMLHRMWITETDFKTEAEVLN